MKKKSLLMVLALTFMSAMVFVSCGGKKDGPTEEVLSKKVYTQVVNQYDYVSDEFHDGLCIVRTGPLFGGKRGAIDNRGNVVIPLEYSQLNDFNDGVAWFQKETGEKELLGLIDVNGKEIIPPTYSDASDFSEGLACVAIDDPESKGWLKSQLYGFVNKKGEVIIPITYNFAAPFSNGLAPVRKGDKMGYINAKGEIELPMIYDRAREFSEGLAVVEKGDKEMVIDAKGEIVYTLSDKMTFEDPYYHDGLISVTKLVRGDWWGGEKKKGFLDKNGEMAIDFIYDDVDSFENGVAEVEKDGDDFYINTKGEKVPNPDYDD